jgi:ferric-dicitrate binding protein FerR (iron transport regulator)
VSEDDRRVDALVALARAAAPPPLGHARRDDLIARAASEAAARPAALPSARSSGAPIAWVLAAAAVTALGLVVLRGLSSGAPTVLAHEGTLALPTGDLMTTAPSVALSIVEISNSARVLSLEAGEALFDVVPLREGERFVVQTPNLEVHVRGTVFSVTREHARTLVRVYEGRVEVRDRDEVTTLGPGEAYRSDEGRITEGEVDPLAENAASAVSRRRSADSPAGTAAVRVAPATAGGKPGTRSRVVACLIVRTDTVQGSTWSSSRDHLRA